MDGRASTPFKRNVSRPDSVVMMSARTSGVRNVARSRSTLPLPLTMTLMGYGGLRKTRWR